MSDHTKLNLERWPMAMIAHIRAMLRGGARSVGLVLGLALLVAACDLGDMLEVDLPDQIPAEGLPVPENAELLTNGAVGDFECAFGAYVALSAVLAGEMNDASPTADRWPYDRRNVNPEDERYSTFDCEALGVYTPLNRARFSADNILGLLEGWTDAEVPERQRLIATAAAYSGYSRVLLAEGFCSVAGPDEGPERTPADVLASAIEKFDVAITAAETAGETGLRDFAYLGRARAQFGLGQFETAVTDAERIPVDFEYVMSASGTDGRRNNRIFTQNGPGDTGGSALSVGPSYQTVEYEGVPDPRVVVIDAERVDDGLPIFWQGKYESLSAPIPIASYDEAQLMIAEVEGGQTAVNIINAFHAAAGIPAYDASTASPDEILDQVVEERRRELWLEGHRFHDIRRLELPLDPAPDTPHRRGGLYGDDRCLPLPAVEIRNNPNI